MWWNRLYIKIHLNYNRRTHKRISQCLNQNLLSVQWTWHWLLSAGLKKGVAIVFHGCTFPFSCIQLTISISIVATNENADDDDSGIANWSVFFIITFKIFQSRYYSLIVSVDNDLDYLMLIITCVCVCVQGRLFLFLILIHIFWQTKAAHYNTKLLATQWKRENGRETNSTTHTHTIIFCFCIWKNVSFVTSINWLRPIQDKHTHTTNADKLTYFVLSSILICRSKTASFSFRPMFEISFVLFLFLFVCKKKLKNRNSRSQVWQSNSFEEAPVSNQLRKEREKIRWLRKRTIVRTQCPLQIEDRLLLVRSNRNGVRIGRLIEKGTSKGQQSFLKYFN